MRARIVSETGIIPAWSCKTRIAEIRASLCLYDDNFRNDISAAAQVVEIVKTYNEICKNVIDGAQGFSVDESLIGTDI